MAKTIRDIAKRAEVSVSTASLALNGDVRVKADTRDRILRVADELNYHRMRAARSLSSGHTWTLDVINPAIDAALTSSFNTRFLHGLHDTARKAQYAVALKVVGDETEALATVEHLILERATDGVILMNPSDNEALVEHLAERAFPHVLLGRAANRHVRSVDNDNHAVADDATDDLLRRRSGPVLFLSGPERHTFTVDRREGYRRALERHGMAGEEIACVTDGTAEAARRQVRALLAGGAPFRSVLALSDVMAIGAMRGAREAGRRVPEDVAVMGMNNDDLTEYTDPRLSSVELNAYQLGRRAADALLAALRGDDDAPTRTIVPHALAPREST